MGSEVPTSRILRRGISRKMYLGRDTKEHISISHLNWQIRGMQVQSIKTLKESVQERNWLSFSKIQADLWFQWLKHSTGILFHSQIEASRDLNLLFSNKILIFHKTLRKSTDTPAPSNTCISLKCKSFRFRFFLLQFCVWGKSYWFGRWVDEEDVAGFVQSHTGISETTAVVF